MIFPVCFQYRRHAAVFILRELAVAMPTYFYQQISTFFDHIFNAIFDPKPAIRQSAGEALRAALIVTSQRENTKQCSEPQWYKISYAEAVKSFNEDPAALQREPKGMTRDDRIHGSMIIFNELFRCSNANWERPYNTLKALLPDALSCKLGDGSSAMYVSGSGVGSTSGSTNQLTTIVPRLKAPFVKKIGTTQLVDMGEHHTVANQKFNTVCIHIHTYRYLNMETPLNYIIDGKCIFDYKTTICNTFFFSPKRLQQHYSGLSISRNRHMHTYIANYMIIIIFYCRALSWSLPMLAKL